MAAVAGIYEDLAVWRADLAARSGRLEFARRCLLPITDDNANVDRLGPIARFTVDGRRTPAAKVAEAMGAIAVWRMDSEAPGRDVLQNWVRLPSGSTVAGNKLLRGKAAAVAAQRLRERRLARHGTLEGFDASGELLYAETGTDADRSALRWAAFELIADTLSTRSQGWEAHRRWAEISYLLYQSPRYKRGSDAVTRTLLVAFAYAAGIRTVALLEDSDLRAMVYGQRAYLRMVTPDFGGAPPAA